MNVLLRLGFGPLSMGRLGLLIVMGTLSTGCTTLSPQTKAALSARGQFASAAALLDVEPLPAPPGDCGPVSLTMALNAAGSHAQVAEVTPLAVTPGKAGSLPADLVSASRRLGFFPVEVQTLSGVLTEVAAGRPVIVLQNLGFSWAPRWHYALVVGYDLDAQVMILHTGNSAAERMPMTYFERHWQGGRYWGLVVLKAGQLAASADELAHLKAAVGLEQGQNYSEAQLAYRAILKRWPLSLGALIGLGNLSYNAGDLPAAIGFLRQATRAHPESLAARNNLAVAEAAAQSTRLPEKKQR